MTDLEWAQLLIRVLVGITMVCFGIHQIANPKDWREYIPGWLAKIIFSPLTFLQIHGVINLGLGFLFLLGFWQIGMTWIVLAWWASILPFAFYVKWSIGLRDLVIVGSLAALLLIL